MRNVYTVKQVNNYIKNMFTQDFMLNRIYVKGEVSNCKYHTSGHIYFSLKDESGTIACVMFASARSGLSFRMQEGQTVIVLGAVSVYERDGRYQLYAKEIMLDGVGLLYERYEALKQELEEMGMFAAEYKQPIPKFAKKIGIVTAPTGAAIRDIIHIATRRNPYVQLILYPALVQGEEAAASIVKGIQVMEKQDVDVIIVGRGGGSIEDLWAFNEEAVARAIFHCRIPVISAVGHETDTLISDYVADLRAPTPSAAAELAVYEYSAVENTRKEFELRLKRQMQLRIQSERNKAERMALRLKYTHPKQKLNEKRQQAVDLENQLRMLMKQKLDENRHWLALYIEQMRRVSPIEKMSQGYSYVENRKLENIHSVSQVKKGEEIQIRLADGTIHASVTGTKKEDLPWLKKERKHRNSH